MASFWSSLERMPGLNAIPSAWISFMGLEFERFKAALFRRQPEPATRYFCEKCYCAHEIIPRRLEPPAPCAGAAAAPGPMVAACSCGDFDCPDILLAPADLEIWELHWPSLGRLLCRALGLDPKSANLPLYNTRQIGSWSAEAVPVFLSIQAEPEDLRTVIAELVARFQSPFILLLPTSTHLNANCRELLARAKAGCFPLDSTVHFTEDGGLRPARAPGELFLAFSSPRNPRGATIPGSTNLPATAPPPSFSPPYALAREAAGWKLTFDGRQATLKHGIAVLYVAHLLQHPRVPVLAARLAVRIQSRCRPAGGLARIPAPSGGCLVPDDASIIEEAPDKIGDAKILRELRRQHAALEGIIDSEQASEPEKAEAQRDRERNERLQHQYLGRFRDTVEKAAGAVRKSVCRFLDTLRAPPRGQTDPHPLLLRFADHLEAHLLVPSRRYSGPRARVARAELVGCLIYDPQPDVVWSVSQ